MKKVFLGATLALTLMLLTATAALAAVVVDGTVQSIDEVGGTFNILGTDSIVYTVTPPVGFDWTSIAVSSNVEVSGTDGGCGDFFCTFHTFTADTVSILPADVIVVGTIQTLDPLTCSMTIMGDDAVLYTVVPPVGFDCSALAVGDVVTVEGSLTDTTITASSMAAGDTTGGEEDQVNTGFYCSNPTIMQPALEKVALAHEADYATLLNEFCGGGLGIGGINLALNFSEQFGVSSDSVLEMRKTMGWGQVRKALEAAGEETTITTTSTTGHGHGHGGGKPPWAGHGGNHGH